MSKVPLNEHTIHVDMEVIDDDGDIGIIVKCDDPHNVIVKYQNGCFIVYTYVTRLERAAIYEKS